MNALRGFGPRMIDTEGTVYAHIERMWMDLGRLRDELSPATRSLPTPPTTEATLAFLKAAKRTRARRNALFPSDLFADPAWDMLIDLAINRLENRCESVSSICVAANVPTTTALRWLKRLLDEGLVCRELDPADGRRTLVRLTDDALTLIMQIAAR